MSTFIGGLQICVAISCVGFLAWIIMTKSKNNADMTIPTRYIDALIMERSETERMKQKIKNVERKAVRIARKLRMVIAREGG